VLSSCFLEITGLEPAAMSAMLRVIVIGVGSCALLLGAVVVWQLLGASHEGASDTAAMRSQNPAPHADTAELRTVQVEPGLSPAQRPRLPEGTRPALLAFVDTRAQGRLPADFHYQVDRVEDPDEVAAVVAVLRDRRESDTMRHEAANLLRRSACPGLEQVLVDCLQHPDEQERFRSWVVQHLFMVFNERQAADPQSAGDLLLPLLNDPQPAIRREALLSLHRLRSAAAGAGSDRLDVVATAAAWLDDPAAVDLALRILRERGAREYLPQVRAILADESAAPPARIAAIVTLSAWQDHDSRALITRIAHLPDQPANYRLRRSAHMALERLQ
jgi:hypothetical protein